MLRFIFPLLVLTGVMSAGACSRRDPVAEEANNAATTPAQENAVTPEIDAGASDGNSEAAAPPDSTTIPAFLHGRWGLTPGDCTSTRGDAKGLLVVSADQLKFYESVGKPTGALEISPDSASGDFAFTGEGMTWKKYQVLELQNGKLVRTESSPMASFTYARCA
jgi:hypothetical protein